MITQAARSATDSPRVHFGEALRVAFVGSSVWLDNCVPSGGVHGLTPRSVTLAGAHDLPAASATLDEFGPHVMVLFDPPALPLEDLLCAPGVSLGVLTGRAPRGSSARPLERLDRLVSFDPAVTGSSIGRSVVWRAIPPPVSDAYFADVRPLHRAPRPMSIGRSSDHREAMLMPSKHHHDLLQVVHGVSGDPMRELLREYDVGVYVPAQAGGGFGVQVGIHLAAGHLLLAEELRPAHGLERGIDYLGVDSPEAIKWVLDRLGRFPEMHQRVRVRGRLKAEQYRASRLFKRLTWDLLADVSAFGGRAR